MLLQLLLVSFFFSAPVFADDITYTTTTHANCFGRLQDFLVKFKFMYDDNIRHKIAVDFRGGYAVGPSDPKDPERFAVYTPRGKIMVNVDKVSCETGRSENVYDIMKLLGEANRKVIDEIAKGGMKLDEKKDYIKKIRESYSKVVQACQDDKNLSADTLKAMLGVNVSLGQAYKELGIK